MLMRLPGSRAGEREWLGESEDEWLRARRAIESFPMAASISIHVK